MKFKDFIKDKILLIVMTVISLASVEILLIAYDIELISQIYIIGIISFTVLVSILFEFKKKKYFYDQLENNMDDLREKYLISAIIKNPNFIRGNFDTSFIEKEILKK